MTAAFIVDWDMVGIIVVIVRCYCASLLCVVIVRFVIVWEKGLRSCLNMWYIF